MAHTMSGSGSKVGRNRRDRMPGLVAGALGLILLAAAVVSTVTAGREAALADLDHALTTDAASHAVALTEYFERAQAISLLLAHDSVFQQFETGRGGLSGPQVAAASAQAAEAMGYLEKLYPGGISEACLIDSTGTELARVTGARSPRSRSCRRTSPTTRSSRQPCGCRRATSTRPFPYVSHDTNVWVISNTTPMVTASGRTWGLLHFEVPLDTFRPADDEGEHQGFSAKIVDTRTGQILLDSKRPLVGASQPWPARVGGASGARRPACCRCLRDGGRTARRGGPGVCRAEQRQLVVRGDRHPHQGIGVVQVRSAPRPWRHPWPPCCCWPSAASPCEPATRQSGRVRRATEP